MKKILSIIIASLCLSIGFSQTYNMSTDSVIHNCLPGGKLYDSGGTGADYGQDEQFVLTICPSVDALGIVLNSASFGSAGDFLCVYDGTSPTAPLLACYTTSNLPPFGTSLRATINNPSGCLTFQFVSDATTPGGNFDFDLECLPACKSVEAEITSTIPAVDPTDTIYINSCPGDSVQFFGNGIYDTSPGYAQSNASSQFYWDFGDGTNDTTQNPIHSFPEGQIFSVNLVVEDVAGCLSRTEIDLRIRQAPSKDINFNPDPVLICLEDTIDITAFIDFIQIGDSTFLDTITGQSAASVVDTVFLPDDSNGNAGDGITTPVIYPLDIFGYVPGTTLTSASDLIDVCIDMEHSFVGDLDIVVVCPNGQSTNLVDFSPPFTPGNNLGVPGTATVPGTTFEYCWSPASTAGSIDVGEPSLLNDPIAAGTYEAVGNWNDLIGCPFNGEWSIQVFDDYGGDDGWTVGASISLNPQFLLDPDTFLIYYVNPEWDANSKIISVLNDTVAKFFASDTLDEMIYFNVENNMGCELRDSLFVDVDVFVVNAIPEDTILCDNDTIQLNASLENVSLQCETDYTVTTIPVNALSSGTATNVALGDDALSPTINLPFPFEFFCETKNDFQISSNGFLSFNAAGDDGCCSGQNLPDVGVPNDLIALYWSDFDPTSGGQVSHFVTGTAPNRVYVVNFQNVPHFFSAATVTGQIQLHESSNFVEIHCVDCQTDNGTITIGIENAAGDLGYAAPGHNATAAGATNQAWRFSPSNSLGNYSFNWSPNTNISDNSIQNPEVWPATSTDYIIDVTNSNNCTYSDTAIVNIAANLASNITNDTVICSGDSIQLSFTGWGMSATYSWTPVTNIVNANIFNPTVYPVTPTTYSVDVVLGNCSTSDSVFVDVLSLNTVDFTPNDTAACNGDFISLTANSGLTNYEWNFPDGSIVPNQSILINSDGHYWFTFDGSNGCRGTSDSLLASFLDNPNVVINGGVDPVQKCTDDSVLLFADGQPNYSYQWMGNLQTGPNYNVFNDGTYTLNVSANYPINNISCSEQFTVNVVNVASPVIDFTDEPNVLCCGSDTITFNPYTLPNVSAMDSAFWNGVYVSGDINITAAGAYNLEIRNTVGCNGAGTYNMDQFCLNPAIMATETLEANQTEVINVTSDPTSGTITSYAWTPSELFDFPDMQNPSFTSDVFGENAIEVDVTVNYTFGNGTDKTCMESATSSIFVTDEGSIEMPSAFSPNGDGVNETFGPVVTGNVNINAFSVYNRWGIKVYDYSSDNPRWDGNFEGLKQPVEVYTYYIAIEIPDGTVQYYSGTVTLIK